MSGGTPNGLTMLLKENKVDKNNYATSICTVAAETTKKIRLCETFLSFNL